MPTAHDDGMSFDYAPGGQGQVVALAAGHLVADDEVHAVVEQGPCAGSGPCPWSKVFRICGAASTPMNPAADHADARHAAFGQERVQTVDVGDGFQREHVGLVDAGDGRDDGPCARREDEFVVRLVVLGAVGQVPDADGARVAVDGDGLAVDARADAVPCGEGPAGSS